MKYYRNLIEPYSAGDSQVINFDHSVFHALWFSEVQLGIFTKSDL